MPNTVTLRIAPLLLIVLAALALSTLALSALASGETVMDTEAWDSTDAGFAKCNARVAALHSRNLLARPGVKVALASLVSDVRALTDGDAGVRGGEGRTFTNGQPSVITFYLGEPKTVKEVGLFTFNGDTRANQDYEVRFSDNSAQPGVMPTFREKPDLTTGNEILGRNGGGYHTSFVDTKGGPLVPGKIDWVQFKIWRTYNVKAGQPAKTTTPSGASALIELEVLSEKNDTYVPSPEELARRRAVRDAPKQPEFIEKPTWRETIVASRETLHEWECLHDKLATPVSVATFKPWHALGPLPGERAARSLVTTKQLPLFFVRRIGKKLRPIADHPLLYRYRHGLRTIFARTGPVRYRSGNRRWAKNVS